MQQLTGILLDLTRNKQEAFLSSAKFVGINRRHQSNSLSSADPRFSFIWRRLSCLPICRMFCTEKG